MLDYLYIDHLIDIRREARDKKDWKLSDEIRDYLDERFVFIFDVKGDDGNSYQEVYHLNEKFFNKIHHYVEQKKIEEDESVTIIPAWSENQMEKIGRLYNKKFDTKRKFLEFELYRDAQAVKLFEAWLYSTNSK